jgi:hypothetical protein
MEVEICKFLEALDKECWRTIEILAEVRGLKCDLEAAMRSTFLYRSLTVHLESVSIDQQID